MQTKSGKAIHPIGIGTWGIAGTMQPAHGNEAQEIEAMRYSMSKGQNHFDCAEMYGGFYTDEVVGLAIEGAVREDLFMADKLGRNSVAEGKVRPTVDLMLKKLGTTYIDLLYIHAPWEGVDWKTAIPQIDALIDEGVVRYFGVSNFTVQDMELAASVAKHPIAANQMHYNALYKDEVSEAFRTYCHRHDIVIVAYRPVERREVLEDKTLQTIAASHDATPAQVAQAWLIAKSALPIPKAVQKSHIDENVAAVDLKLSEAELQQLDEL